jgi:hypothetical protein
MMMFPESGISNLKSGIPLWLRRQPRQGWAILSATILEETLPNEPSSTDDSRILRAGNHKSVRPCTYLAPAKVSFPKENRAVTLKGSSPERIDRFVAPTTIIGVKPSTAGCLKDSERLWPRVHHKQGR